jgi:hypothetical protein
MDLCACVSEERGYGEGTGAHIWIHDVCDTDAWRGSRHYWCHTRSVDTVCLGLFFFLTVFVLGPIFFFQLFLVVISKFQHVQRHHVEKLASKNPRSSHTETENCFLALLGSLDLGVNRQNLPNDTAFLRDNTNLWLYSMLTNDWRLDLT